MIGKGETTQPIIDLFFHCSYEKLSPNLLKSSGSFKLGESSILRRFIGKRWGPLLPGTFFVDPHLLNGRRLGVELHFHLKCRSTFWKEILPMNAETWQEILKKSSQRKGWMHRFISLIFAVIICFSLRPFPRLFLCTGFLSAQGRQSARCRDPPSFFFGQLTSGRQQKKSQQCQPPIKRTSPKPRTSSPKRFTRRQRQRFNVGLLNGNGRLNIWMPRSCWRNQSSSRDDFFFCLMRTAWNFWSWCCFCVLRFLSCFAWFVGASVV